MRVFIADVHPRFDDGGAEQDVEFTVIKIQHDPFQNRLIHLAVGDGDPGLGHHPLQLGVDMLDGLHPVVHEIDLTLPGQLPEDGLADQLLIVLHHIGAHRVAVLRGRFDHAHIPYPHHGHVQGAGDGRCRQRQDIHVAGDFLQPFLLSHPETLLFIDDHQAQILNTTSLDKSRWVPMSTSTVQSWRP